VDFSRQTGQTAIAFLNQDAERMKGLASSA
jgi:hypothetical protein